MAFKFRVGDVIEYVTHGHSVAPGVQGVVTSERNDVSVYGEYVEVRFPDQTWVCPASAVKLVERRESDAIDMVYDKPVTPAVAQAETDPLDLPVAMIGTRPISTPTPAPERKPLLMALTPSRKSAR